MLQTENNQQDFFGCNLDENDDVKEYYRTQNILQKKASKFSIRTLKNSFNIILLDMRASILGCSDFIDYKNILYGKVRDNGQILFPGVFSERHPGYNDLKHLHQSIHYFGFVVEEKFEKNELLNKIHWFNNPQLTCDNIFNLNKFLLSNS